MKSGRQRNEQGATAIMFALLATVLFGVAAIVVDVGNAYARQRDIQTEADLAALAGGAHLPASAGDAATLSAVLKYLKQNAVAEQEPDAWTVDQLEDGNLANGEVEFLDNGNKLKVTAPRATVTTAFAGVIGMGDIDVQEDATVGIFSPGHVLPFHIPGECAIGIVRLKAASSSGDPSPMFNPGGGNGNSIPKVSGVLPFEIEKGAPDTIEIKGENFGSSADSYVGFTRGSQNIHVRPDTVTQGDPDTMTVPVPPAVYDAPLSSGTVWLVRVGIDVDEPLSGAAGTWSSDNAYGEVTVMDPAANPDCGQKATGDFGQLFSPRKDSDVKSEITVLNMIKGIDHEIALFDGSLPSLEPVDSPPHDTCNGIPQSPIAGAIPDYEVNGEPVDGANCLNIDNGVKAPDATQGMVTGEGVHSGRLDVENTEGCTQSQASFLGKTINTDSLECFLIGTATVAQVISDSPPENAIDARIYKSPRFFVVPVIDYPFPPPNGFYPVVDFVPVFITDLTANNGNTKLESMTVAIIHPDALPDSDGGGPVSKYLGTGPAVVRLVD